MTLFYSMAAFALAASITPGPVNVVALGSGARYGLMPSLRHVTGATVGFVVLLVAVGFGVYELLQRMPILMHAIRWFGVAFLLYMAYKLAVDDGELASPDDRQTQRGPTMSRGAVMQWLNPKAWLAALAGMGAYTGGDPARIWQFAAIYFVVCWLSVGCWAAAGAMLRHHMRDAKRMRYLNRGMAALLAASAAYLVAAG
ncbi:MULTISPECIES: LysE family translocator [Pandoraea]|uniref:LysE family translocator n=1 Tax=Pandoraea TaxID=93217 RepID=UPI001F5D7247|nr:MULTISPECIES: LysE family translocator [Pandoraea]MCI3207566.1 lysine transporter LysE [Pandoraea sp. LA3]MDN4585595.1 lysine transporter LysE [Pandoraea capi]